MNSWSNIEISSGDPEIINIDEFAITLGILPGNIRSVRELITRFEVCHFKYREHLEYILDSIRNLSPTVETAGIGKHHISKGEEALKNDNTGRSSLGQQYLYSLQNWLGENMNENSEFFNAQLNEDINKRLGVKDKEKERIIRLLAARLTWNWESLEKYQQRGEYKELEQQVIRTDICHYAFPDNLELLLEGIGRLETAEKFEGCGSSNVEIKSHIEQHFFMLCDYLNKNINKNNTERAEQIKLWLTACLAKTLKEQTGSKTSLPKLNGN